MVLIGFTKRKIICEMVEFTEHQDVVSGLWLMRIDGTVALCELRGCGL